MPISLITKARTFTPFLLRKTETVSLVLQRDTGRVNITQEKGNISKLYSIGISRLLGVSILIV